MSPENTSSAQNANQANNRAILKNIRPFDPSNGDIRTQLIFETWATIPVLKIVTLMLHSHRKGFYSIRAIGEMLRLAKSTVHDAIRLLLSGEYIVELDGRYYLNTALSVRYTEQLSDPPDASVRQTGQERPTDRTGASGTPDTPILLKTNNKNNIKNECAREEDSSSLEESKFKEIIKDAFISSEEPSLQNDNHFILCGRRPLRKFPCIKLTERALIDVLEDYERSGIPIDSRGIHLPAFKSVQSRLETKRAKGESLDGIDCYSWLIGFAKRDLLQTLKNEQDLKRSEIYLGKATT